MTLGLSRLTRRATLAAGVAFSTVAMPALAQDVVELDFWTEFSAAPEKPVLDAIVAQFNAANPGIVVTHTGFENDASDTAVRAGFAGDDLARHVRCDRRDGPQPA